MNRSLLLQTLPVFENKNLVLKNDQSTNDIIKEILQAHNKYRSDYKKIAKFFLGHNDNQTAKNCYTFLKKNIAYVIDSGENQLIKSPSAIIATAKADCKCYSLFVAGILDALNVPFCFRFSSYKDYDKTPGHVFIVMHPGKKNEIWIDAVLPTLNNRKQYTYKTDRMISSISGIGKVKSAKKIAKKAAGKTLGQKLKKGAKVVLKVAAAPARNAFLLLVKLNFGGLATKLLQANTKKPTDLKRLWEGSLGGKINALVTAINTGSKKKKIGCIDCDNQIGAVTAAAALAAAAPIIAKVTQWLKEQGVLDAKGKIDLNKLQSIAQGELNKKVKDIAEETLAPEAEAAAESEAAAADIVDEPTGEPTGKIDLNSNNKIPSTTGSGNNTMLYVGAAAVVALVMFSKK